MTNTLLWKRKAAKQLLKLQKEHQVQIRDAVTQLANMPNVKQVKALTHHQYGYRLRVGNYRVLFDWDGELHIIAIEEVKKRDQHTYQ